MQILIDSEYQVERDARFDDATTIQAVNMGLTEQTVTIRVADGAITRRYKFRVLETQIDVEPFTEEDRETAIKRLQAELRELQRTQQWPR